MSTPAAVKTNHTVIDEVRLALDIVGGQDVFTDEEIKRFIWDHMGWRMIQTFVLYNAGTSGQQVFIAKKKRASKLWDISFTGDAGCEYTVNCNGSIEVTKGTHTSSNPIMAYANWVDFAGVMVDAFHYLATHRSIEAGVSMPIGTYMPRTASEILLCADRWRGITNGSEGI